MRLIELKNRPEITTDSKLSKAYNQFGALLTDLKHRELNENVISIINNAVTEINSSTLVDNDLKKLVKKYETVIVKQLEKQHKIVPQKYYQTLWMMFGFTAFGLPLGVIFGYIMKNMGLLGLGLPFGMVLGLIVGSRMDAKALAEGRQLGVEIKN